QRIRSSLQKLPFRSLTTFQFRNRLEQAAGIFWGSEKISGFFESFVVRKRNHHHGLLVVTCNDQRLVVAAHSVHCFGEVLTSSGISYCVHKHLHTCTENCTSIYHRSPIW